MRFENFAENVFFNHHQAFYKRASSLVPRVADLHKRMEDSYREACVKYGENYKNIEPDAFFRIFQDFVSNYKVIFSYCLLHT